MERDDTLRISWCKRVPDKVVEMMIRKFGFSDVARVCGEFRIKSELCFSDEKSCSENCRFYKGIPETVMKFRLTYK